MTPDQAADLAARTLAAITAERWEPWLEKGAPWLAADRERVVSDLAGLQSCWRSLYRDYGDLADHAHRYADGLRRTARLYGVAL